MYVLIVDDEAAFRNMLAATVAAEGLEAHTVASGEEAIDHLHRSEAPGLVLMDLRMVPGGLDGIATLRGIRETMPDLPVALITAFGDVQTAVEAMKLGALDFLEKPLDLSEVRRLLADVRTDDWSSGDDPPRPRVAFGGIVPGEEGTQAALELLQAAASSSAPILITGESGTGKELAARFVHERSDRRRGPLVTVNCAAIPPNLLEAEMFGHEAGAFTGATRARIGRFEAADGGTLLLDEIGEMDVALQAKLLRVLQEKELEPLGAVRPRRVDVRCLATTNRDLTAAIGEGRFREDLYFRLNVFEVTLPPLRERPSDILALARLFVRELSAERPRRLSEETARVLSSYRWPGNVRQLRNAMERSVILARGGLIRPKHLPPSVAASPAADVPTVRAGTSVREMEKELIIKTLALYDGNRTRTAEALGMSRRALQYKLKRHQIA